MADLNFTITDKQGVDHALTAGDGANLMQVLREAVDLTLGTCGGAISCGTCLVRLSGDWLASLPAASEDEAEMLEALGASADCRLSCQLALGSGAQGQQGALVEAD
ncbi:MAG: 2Fe-2S iron-sulfur cluster binding domain-containing protein [Sphingomonadales bacterium]|nr:2Fe-2S iron-sulfur cluster binding domain-containing protein [Sphingomonadales bacterium]